MKQVDFLVIGSGIAGLSFSLKAAKYGSVCLLTKDVVQETSTRYAQGGIAAVMYDPDTYEKHIKDTMVAGHELSDPEIVRITITESTERVKDLIQWGVDFDKNISGKYDLAREGGHSEFRVLHHKDITGLEIQQKLYAKAKEEKNIEILEKYFAVEIITQHHLGISVTKHSKDIVCFGAYVHNPLTNTVETILAKTTILATGGIGNVYGNTTNPSVSTGDGIAMVHRAKGAIRGMEFVQFHPTTLYNPNERPAFLITEALRGAGAILKDYHGSTFMSKYDARGSLAPRDIVARAIDHELKISGEHHVYLDARHIDKSVFFNHFPTIYSKCLSIGIDATKDMIPVVPAAHYSCGGILVDQWGCSSIENLYALGECASTGLHGANRLASNSLLESLVFSHRACEHASKKTPSMSFREGIRNWNAEGTVSNEEMILVTQNIRELQSIMSYYVGIVRSDQRLERAYKRLNIIYQETETLYQHSVITKRICELRNMVCTAYLIIREAMKRKESLGLHYSIDYPPKENL